MKILFLFLLCNILLIAKGETEEKETETGFDDGECVCVPFYQCQDGDIVDDGTGILDPRNKPPPDEELPLDARYSPPDCGQYYICCRAPGPKPVRPYYHACGRRNPSGINSRILSASKGEADFGEWPWQVAVIKQEPDVEVFQCGGVLIDTYHVLTVAHCVKKFVEDSEFPLKVRLGEWDTQTETEFMIHEDYDVEKIIIHDEFKMNNLHNDIAMLKLSKEVEYRPHIDSVCLPQPDDDFTDQECVVTGWGKSAYKGSAFSNVMKEVALPVISHAECEKLLRKTRLGRYFRLHEGFLCAGGEKERDSCKGDGGGPLVCYRKDDATYTLAGLVAWGIDCGLPNVPGVYVNVKKYMNWIVAETGKKEDDYWPSIVG